MPSLRSRILYQLLRLSGSPFAADAPLEEQRAYVERQGRRVNMPTGVGVERMSIGDMYAEWLQPREARRDRALLYLHGGGYVMGSCETHRALAARIAVSGGAPALLINYRVAPEHPFPAALEDAQTAYGWLLASGIEPPRIALAGDSAGGGLALALALSLRDGAGPPPAGIACLSPWVDLTVSGESMTTGAKADPLITRQASVLNASRYAGQHDPAAPLISPLFADLRGLPPLLIQVGQHEVLLSDSERLAEQARQSGVDATLEVWSGMWHVWQAYAGFIPDAQRAIDKVGAFIRARLA
ncbi:MAG: alpha/beta hydrolase [Planctomycetota bacterium]